MSAVITTMPPAERFEFVSCRLKHRYSRRPRIQIGRNGYRLRAYHCEICNGYHLTKRPFAERFEV